jgi:glycosyltransferase involved in cell wall biosynthesis
MGFPDLIEFPRQPRKEPGWPWNVELPRYEKRMPGSSTWPKISIVTPSLNQGQFIEETIRSVLLQGYPELEYIIIDGGSSDGSVDIIRKYQDNLCFWVSETDGGQYDAINKGFAKATGEIMAWINADDKYTPWAFSIVGEIFSTLAQVEWITSLFPITWDDKGRATTCHYRDGYSREGFRRGENLHGAGWSAKGWIQQESTFWRRSLWERSGGYIDTSLHLAADFELWARFYQYAELVGVETPLGGFRIHGHQKTTRFREQYIEESKSVLRRYGSRPFGKFESFVRSKLNRYTPGRLQSVMALFGLYYQKSVCRYESATKSWRLFTR